MPEQLQVIRWEQPPATNAKGGQGRANSKYDPVADQLLDRPNEWALVWETADPDAAASVSGVIREGRVVCFRPRGDFEACVRTVNGARRVYARYLGDGNGDG